MSGTREIWVDKLSILLYILEVMRWIAASLHQSCALDEVDALLARISCYDLLSGSVCTLKAELSNCIT